MGSLQPFALSKMIVRAMILVGLRRGCVFSPLLFIIFVERISQRSTTPGCMTIRVEFLLFADDIVNCSTPTCSRSICHRLCRSLQTKPKLYSSQDKTNSVLCMSMESKWRNLSSSGSNDGRLIDVLGQRVQFYDRFIDQ